MTDPAGSGRERNLAALLVCAVALVAYVATFRFPFVFDDNLQIVGNATLQSWRFVPGYFTNHTWFGDHGGITNFYRPLFMLWLRSNYAVFGLWPAGWHAGIVLLHVTATLMVFRLTLRLSKQVFAASAAALIFAVHPVHVENAAWVSGALDPLLTILLVVGLLCYLNYRERRARTRWLIASLAAYGCAVLAKEPAIILPAIIVTYEWLFGDRGSHLPARRATDALKTALPFLPVALIYVVLRSIALSGFAHNAPMTLGTFFFTLPSVVWFYFRLLFVPTGLSAFYSATHVHGPQMAAFFVPLSLLVAGVAAVLLIVRRLSSGKRVAQFGCFWWALSLLPVLYLPAFEPTEIVHDRYVYLASVGFCMFAGVVLSNLRIGEKQVMGMSAAPFVATSGIVAVLFVMCVIQQTYWASDLALATRGVQIAPDNEIANTMIAVEMDKRQQFEFAFPIYQKVVRLNPDSRVGNYNLAIGYFRMKKFGDAERYFSRVVELDPYRPSNWYFLGVTHLELARLDLAQGELERAIALDRSAKEPHAALAIVREKQGDLKGALDETLLGAQIDPSDKRLEKRAAELRGKLKAAANVTIRPSSL